MKILLVAATHFEIEGILLALNANENIEVNDSIDYLVTGPGIFSTAYELGRYLIDKQYSLIINVGIAGVFDKKIPLGTVFNVVEDVFADFGAEDGTGYLSAFEIGLLNGNQYPYKNSILLNDEIPHLEFLQQIPEAKGITVNTVHGATQSIKKVLNRYTCDIESMEGAAFMYICKVNNLPFLQIRAVSNYVEKRNRKAWRIPIALDNLSSVVTSIVNELLAKSS
jgi:futalosine hydrolase